MHKQEILQYIADKLSANGIVFTSNQAKPILYVSEYFGQYELPTANNLFKTPAVFVEFAPIDWRGKKTSAQTIRIHKVFHTLANPAQTTIQQKERQNTFELIPMCIDGLSGTYFNSLIHIQTGSTETVDAFYFEIDTFQCTVVKREPNPFNTPQTGTIEAIKIVNF